MNEMPAKLAAFFGVAPAGSLRAFSALAAPESLTDDLARQLLELACSDPFSFESFLRGLHLGGFVIERNSEWHISREERKYLAAQLLQDAALFRECHSFLASLADATAEVDSMEIPTYLSEPVGRAYHHAALSPQEGLALYRRAFQGSLGQQWLAARLATEQEEMTILPVGAIEPAFMRGMVLYREGHTSEAMPVLRPVAYSDERRSEVAIAAHLYGRHLWRRNAKEAESLLRWSLEILSSLGDQFGQAQVLHTLGQKLWRSEPGEAEDLLRQSLEILISLGDLHGQAQVLHTLGQKLWRSKPNEAEGLLRDSLEIEVLGGNLHGQAQVLHTLGQKLWRSEPGEAEDLLRQGLEILISLGDRYGEAQVLHTLGLNLMNLDRAQAEEHLRRSLAIGEDLGNVNHQAVASFTLGRLLWPTDSAQARELMLRSLELNRRVGNRWGQRIVLRELDKHNIEA